VIYGLLYVTGSKIPKYLKEIKRIEKLSREELKRYQEEKLKKLLLHAWENVPYYKKVLSESEVVVDGKVNLNSFDKIPILTKDIIRNEGKNLYSLDYRKRKFYTNSSGGSSGEPVTFIQDKHYDEWNIANKIWYKFIAGQDVGEKELRLWGSERDLLQGKESFRVRLRNWLYHRKEFNSFKMSENEMKGYAKEWNKFRPSWIECYAQSVYGFAQFIKTNNLSIHPPKKGILTSAGTLYPEMKKLIEEVFHCNVYNRYGSREVGDMACGKDKLRLSVWNHHLEVINNRIYVTTLNNFSMPFIRYGIGDIGKMSKDRLWLEKIQGREMNMFKTKEGKLIPAEFFIHFVGVVYNKGFISKFQVIQKDYDLIEIKVVIKNKEEFNAYKKNIEKSIKQVMGKNCRIKWSFVKEIKTNKSGKYLYTISKVKQ